ncbi:MAG: hypothetical protein AAB538_04490, partial [Patescibacteria group bacterium]
ELHKTPEASTPCRKWTNPKRFMVLISDTTERQDLDPVEPPPLMDIARQLNIHVHYENSGKGYYGRVAVKGNEIELCSHEAGVFFHELAHCLHGLTRPEGKNQGGQRPEQEIIAEFTACVLSALYQTSTDYTDHAFNYINLCARQLDRKPAEAVIAFLSDVGKILEKLEELGASVPVSQT